MDIRLLRGWMYDRVNTANRTLKEEFKSGVYGFIDHVRSQPGLVSSADEIRCPCRKCGNRKYIKWEVVIVHLCKWGFKDDYWYWTSHGEVEPTWNNNYVEASSNGHFFHNEGNNRHKDLVHNALNEKLSSDEFHTKSRKAKQNRAVDSAGSTSNFSGAKNRVRLEDESRKKLRRDPRQDEVFFAQYAKKNADGELQEWANRKAESVYTGYMESISSQASNSDGEELSFPPLEDQLKIRAETQGVPKKQTAYGLCWELWAPAVTLTDSLWRLLHRRLAAQLAEVHGGDPRIHVNSCEAPHVRPPLSVGLCAAVVNCRGCPTGINLGLKINSCAITNSNCF